MKNWTIRQRILGSFAGILVMILVMGGLSYLSLQQSQTDARVILDDAAPGMISSHEIRAELLDNFGRLLRHISLTDAGEIQQNKDGIQAVRVATKASMSEYEKSIFSAEDKAKFDGFRVAMERYWVAQDLLLKLANGSNGREALRVMNNDVVPAYDEVRMAVKALSDYNEAKVLTSTQAINSSIAAALQAFMQGTAVIFIFALIAGYFLQRAILQPLSQLVAVLDVMRQGDFTERLSVVRRDEFGNVAEGFNRMTDELAALVGQVQKSGLQVTTSVTEIAATSKQQQATASAIAATTAEIGATSREISATSRQLVATMHAVSSVADESATLAVNGQAGLAAMGDTMRHVMEATKSINAKLVVLSEKASNINQVITTISKVAEQTNLLSLNAAIEAEKAGEHGRGFSVVATEIRRLADQTAIATFDIGQTVKDIQTAVSSSVMGMDKFSDEVRRGMDEVQQISAQLAQIIHNVQTLAPRVVDVNEGMQAQTISAEQITESLVLLNESAQQTVESLRQSSMAIDDLNQVANGLRGGVSRFKLRA